MGVPSRSSYTSPLAARGPHPRGPAQRLGMNPGPAPRKVAGEGAQTLLLQRVITRLSNPAPELTAPAVPVAEPLPPLVPVPVPMLGPGPELPWWQ